MSLLQTTTTNVYLSTPGEILREEFLEPMGVSAYRLAKTVGMSETAIGQILNNKRRITVPTAYRFAKAFGTTPEFWMNLQNDYDILSFDSSTIGDIQPIS